MLLTSCWPWLTAHLRHLSSRCGAWLGYIGTTPEHKMPTTFEKCLRSGSVMLSGVSGKALMAGFVIMLAAGMTPARLRQWLFARSVQESIGSPLMRQVARRLAPA